MKISEKNEFLKFRGTVFALESANVVGYANKAVPANTFVQAGAQFFDVASDTLDLSKVVTGLVGVDFDEAYAFEATAPHIQVVGLDGKPTKYYYLNDGWYDNGTPDGDFKPGWCDGFGNIVDLVIEEGAGFWYKSSVDGNFTGAGAVMAETSGSVTAPNGVFAIKANVFPIAVNLNDATQVEFPNIKGVDFDEAYAFEGTAPHIQVVGLDGKPTKYYYLNDGWYDNGTPDGDFKAGWCDGFGNIADPIIEAQQGFWVKAMGGDLEFVFKR